MSRSARSIVTAGRMDAVCGRDLGSGSWRSVAQRQRGHRRRCAARSFASLDRMLLEISAGCVLDRQRSTGAARAARCHDFITAMPDGYTTTRWRTPDEGTYVMAQTAEW